MKRCTCKSRLEHLLAKDEWGLDFLGDPPEEGLGPYRRAFVAPAGHVGIPFEFVERRSVG